MRFQRSLYIILLNCLLTSYGNFPAWSQSIGNTTIKGLVIDFVTKEPLPYVSVFLENTTVGTLTDTQGRYTIITQATSYKIKFSFLGYEVEEQIITPGKTQTVNAELKPTSYALDEVTVKPTRSTYSNKNNPAVELIDKVIENKDLNRKEGLDYFNYRKYEKIRFSVSNLSDDFVRRNSSGKYGFVFENIDTTRMDGRDNLPLFIKETVSRFYYRKDPKAVKEIIEGEKTINFSEYIDNRGVTANLNYLYQNINIYDNTIFFLSNKFLSPIASEAPVFYRYYIQDTSLVNDVNCIKLFFEPRNPADFLFHGFLFITADSSYAVKKIDMSFNKGINIDWVKDVRIVQDFDFVGRDELLLTNDEVSIDFGITGNLPGMTGHRVVSYSSYSVNESIPDSVFRGMESVTNIDASFKTNQYWELNRNPPLSANEKQIYGLIDSIKNVPGFKRDMDIIMLITTQFINLGKFEIGPVGSFYSFNYVEGNRVKFGGRTTPDLNTRVYLEGYLAYGFKDQEFKYNIAATYSLSNTSIYKFPVKSIKLSYQNDLKIPGQELQFSTGDNLLLSFKRGVNDKFLHNNTYKLEYLNEFENHFSFTLGYSFTRQAPAGNLFFVGGESFPALYDIPYINISEPYLKVRYSKNEKFYQGKLYRVAVPSKNPVYLFQYAFGSKDLNNDYNYQRIKLTISKRFYFSIVGYTDVAVEAGKIFGKVPFPLLFIHNANQTYTYQKNSYNMMNFLEFVSDQYASLNIDHSFNGFFFNKVPLLKRMKLREVATFKILYGSLSENNNPDYQQDLFKFPADVNGTPLTYPLGKKPYIEASLGVSNLFRIFRIDFVKRFSYLDNPNVSSFGVRVQLRIDI